MMPKREEEKQQQQHHQHEFAQQYCDNDEEGF
jgi:hypothetical protein